jgi:hypothetical protein
MYIKTTIHKKGVGALYNLTPPPHYHKSIYRGHEAADRRLDSSEQHSLEYRSLSNLGLKVRRTSSGSGLKRIVF